MQSEALSIPNRALPYILLQRLEVQALGSRMHYSKLGRLAYGLYERSRLMKRLYAEYSTKVEPRLRATRISSAYSATMLKELETILPHLPDRIGRVLGIGPGVAGLEAHLSNYLAHQGLERPHLVLLDKSEVTDVYYDFHDVAAAYNSLDISREVLIANGHPPEKITTLDAAVVARTTLPKFDLVTSLIAWGFHFPVTTYLEMVHDSLEDSGVLILDVRKETGGREALESAFRTVTVIVDDPKFTRVAAYK